MNAAQVLYCSLWTLCVWNDLQLTPHASTSTFRQLQSILKTILPCLAYGI